MKKRIIGFLLAALTVFSLAPAAGTTAAAEDYSQYNVSGYNAALYTTPIWQGNVVVNECVYPIKDKDGTLKPFKLTYPATQIICVKNYQLTTTYVAGRDYTLNANGEFVIPSGSSIATYDYRYIHPNTNPYNYSWDVYYPHRDEPGIENPGWEYWEESTRFSLQTICVTYVHAGNDYITRPEAVGNALPRTMAKLTSGQAVKIVTSGDSVTAGSHASGVIGISPYAPAYPGLIKDGLAVKFNNPNITLINSGIGGTTSDWNASGYTVYNTVVRHNPDLVTLCFGMNDSSYNRVGYTDQQFYNNMKGQIDYIKTNLPNCEILLVSSLYGNYYTFPRERYESHARILHQLAEEYAGQGVAVCDPQAIESQILSRKEFIDFMGDNMVHPNDFGMRLTAQTIIDALRYASAEESADYAISKLRAAVSPARGKNALYESMLAEARSYFISLGDDVQIEAALPAKKAELQSAMRYCADTYHAFETVRVAPKCGAAGRTSDVCSYCGYEKNVTTLPAISGSHTYGTAEITLTATAHNTGTIVNRCTKCGESFETTVPATSSSVNHAFHNDFGYNYMQSALYPYSGGNATIVFDVIPIDVTERSNPVGPCYFGVWLGDTYSVLAGYDFTMQKFVVGGVGMTYSQSMTDIIAQADYSWQKKADGYYPMHRFAINVQGNSLKIYMDGTQVLSTSSSRIGASKTKNDLVLLYTKGEFCLDNFVVSKTSYNVATGSGSTIWTNDCESGMTKMSDWTFGGYTTVDVREYDIRNNFPENHVHSNSLIASHAANEYHGSYDEYECTVCYVRTVVDTGNPPTAHTHSLTHFAAVSAACTAPGSIEYWYCARCGKYFSDSAGNNEITADDIATSELGHDPVETTKAPTCLWDGWTRYVCSRCGEILDEFEAPALGHDWGEWTVTTEPTCCADGVEQNVCRRNPSHVLTRAIPATGAHVYVNGVCTTPGCGAIDPDYVAYGDANNDGTVNLKDLVLVRKYVANYDEATGTSIVGISSGGDANGDGEINLKDVVLLRRYVANYNDETGTSTVVLGPQS